MWFEIGDNPVEALVLLVDYGILWNFYYPLVTARKVEDKYEVYEKATSRILAILVETQKTENCISLWDESTWETAENGDG